jgi:phosphoserine aminotransferase
MGKRLYNFSAGPAVLPLEVLETVKENIVNYNDTGLGVMEMSHRSKPFIKIAEEAEASLRELLSISDDYAVLFLQGGATLQFSMVPMNILGKDQVANYLISGYWAEKAMAEAKKVGETNVAASSKDKNHSYIPKQVSLSEKAAYLHFTSNNTIFGTQFKTEPTAGNTPLVCDASSDFLHKKLDVSKYGIIYAGA